MTIFDYDLVAFLGSKECSFAHQFADKCRAHTFCLVNQRWQMLQAQLQTLSIQIKEPPAAIAIRKRYLDGLVNASRTSGQGWLKDIRPVRSEQEQNIGIVRQSIHLIEQFEEQRVTPGVLLRAFFCDQVNILEDNSGGLQQACHLA